jgi:hypothetical protein
MRGPRPCPGPSLPITRRGTTRLRPRQPRIAKIPSCERKKSCERLLDSQNFIVKKEKSLCERLLDIQNSIVKKEKSSCERLLDSQNSIVKKEKSSCESLLDSQNSIVKKEKFHVKGFVIARILS